jgi:hypothetical protein
VARRRASLAFLLMLAICAPAQAAPKLAVFGAAQDAPLSDGERWAAIPVVDGMEVLDGRGDTITRRTVDLAGPCDAQFGIPRGVGGGFVLVECSYRSNQVRPRLLVYDLVARTFTDALGTEVMYRSAEGATVNGIGRRWIAIGLSGHRGGSTLVLLDWRTGRSILPRELAANHVRDLDLTAGERRVCRTIHKPRSSRRLFAYRSPFALSDQGTVRPGSKLVLGRCGGRRVTLMRSAKGLRGASLGASAAAWVDGATIRARGLRTGAVKSWRTPRDTPSLGLAQLGRHLLVTIQGGPRGGPRGFGFTVYRGRLP